MKNDVGKAVGVYERPAKPKWRRVVVTIALMIVAMAAAVAFLRFFGKAEAAGISQAAIHPAAGQANSALSGRATQPKEFMQMQVTDILAHTGGLQAIARELGMSENQAASGAKALVPAILGGFKKQVQSQPSGDEGLGGLLGRLGGGGLLDNVLAPQPTDVSQGNNVLGHIFGSKDVSRAVADNAASQSGLEPSLLKKMLPMLAMLVAGHMAKQRGASQATPAPSGGIGGLLGGLLGGQAGGNPLDDILRKAGKAL